MTGPLGWITLCLWITVLEDHPSNVQLHTALAGNILFCKLSHWSSGVVSYSTQPHDDTGDKSEFHSKMTADRQFHKFTPAARTFTNENRICWQSQVQILKDRSWVQNSGGSAGGTLYPTPSPWGPTQPQRTRNFLGHPPPFPLPP